MSHLSIYNDRHKEAFTEVYAPKKYVLEYSSHIYDYFQSSKNLNVH